MGSGKTTGAAVLACLAERRGALVVTLTLDPKPDSRDGLRAPRPDAG